MRQIFEQIKLKLKGRTERGKIKKKKEILLN